MVILSDRKKLELKSSVLTTELKCIAGRWLSSEEPTSRQHVIDFFDYEDSATVELFGGGSFGKLKKFLTQ